MKDPRFYPKLLIQIKTTSCFSPQGFYFSCFCLLAPTNEERIFSLRHKLQIDLSDLMAWTVLLQQCPCLSATARSLEKKPQFMYIYIPHSLFCSVYIFPFPHKYYQKLCLAATPSLPPYGYWKPSVTHCLQHPWRYIASASICPLSSPENNEANNFFNYLSRAASSVNKFVLLSPGGLALYFISFFFHMHLKRVLLFILISTASFLSFSSFLFIINFMLLLHSVSFLLLFFFCAWCFIRHDLTFN